MLTASDYAKYPFLPGAREYYGSIPSVHKPLPEILQSTEGQRVLELTRTRLQMAVQPKKATKTQRAYSNENQIMSYVLGRMLISCSKYVKSLTEKMVEYEAQRCIDFLNREPFEHQQEILASAGVDPNTQSMSVIEYVPMAVFLVKTDHKWKLINRDVYEGRVRFSSDEMGDVFKEKIKMLMRERMPIPLQPDARKVLTPVSDEILKDYYGTIMENYGEVTKGDFPPCIAMAMQTLDEGKNLTHPARFALVTFLHRIGMTVEDIALAFEKVPGFDVELTMYQIRHITGVESSTEYSVPTCDTLRTNGVCLHADALCARVNHPLWYYTLRKKKVNKHDKKKVKKDVQKPNNS